MDAAPGSRWCGTDGCARRTRTPTSPPRPGRRPPTRTGPGRWWRWSTATRPGSSGLRRRQRRAGTRPPCGPGGTTPPVRCRTGRAAAASPTRPGRRRGRRWPSRGATRRRRGVPRPPFIGSIIEPRAYQGGQEPLGVRAAPGQGQRVDAGTLRVRAGGARQRWPARVDAGAAGQWLGDSYSRSARPRWRSRTRTRRWPTATPASRWSATCPAGWRRGEEGRRSSAAPTAGSGCAPAPERSCFGVD